MCSEKQSSPTTAEYEPTNTNSRDPSAYHRHSMRVQPCINVVPCEAWPKFDGLGFSIDCECIETSERNLDTGSGGKATVCGMSTTLYAEWCA